jgi:ribosome-associated protein
LSEGQKQHLLKALSKRLNSGSIVSITVEETRSQSQNRRIAMGRLEELVTRAVQIPKKRRATRPTRASKEKRLKEKKERSDTKKKRKHILV